MAAKLCLTNPEQTTLLAQYVFNLAKYDTNYDIRDRARFLRAFVFPPPGAEDNKLVARARDIFLATKPASVALYSINYIFFYLTSVCCSGFRHP